MMPLWKLEREEAESQKRRDITFLLKHSFFFIFKVICPYGLISRLALSEVLFSNLNVFFFVYFFNNYALEGYIWGVQIQVIKLVHSYNKKPIKLI